MKLPWLNPGKHFLPKEMTSLVYGAIAPPRVTMAVSSTKFCARYEEGNRVLAHALTLPPLANTINWRICRPLPNLSLVPQSQCALPTVKTYY